MAAAAAIAPDPIFAAIEAHRDSYKALGHALVLADRTDAPEFEVRGHRIVCTNEAHIASASRFLGLDESYGARAVILFAQGFLAAEKGIEPEDPAQGEALAADYQRSCAELTAHVEAETQAKAACDIELRAQDELVATMPTTSAGIVGAINYVIGRYKIGDDFLGEDNLLTLLETIGEAVEAIRMRN